MPVHTVDLDKSKPDASASTKSATAKSSKKAVNDQSTYQKVKQWIGQHRLLAYSSGVILLIILTSIVILWQAWAKSQPPTTAVKPTPTPAPSPTPTPEVPSIPNPLNGVLQTKTQAAKIANLRPLAVMVENHLQARPQSGINQADIVYEALAEGGITRLMPVFLSQQPDKIGPVRSARMHFVSWAAEYQALYAHWGGSPEAKQYLATHNNPRNIDQFYNAGAFYRDRSAGKSLEHTGYSSTKLLRQVAKAKGWEQSPEYASWKFKDQAPTDQRPQSQTVSIPMLGTPGYQIGFTYQPKTNSYLRSTGGQPHLDAQGEQWFAKTIILQVQPVRSYSRASGKAAIDLTTTGSGTAVIIQDGQATEGRWSKPAFTSRTTFTDPQNNPIPLNRGKIWIISVPLGTGYSY